MTISIMILLDSKQVADIFSTNTNTVVGWAKKIGLKTTKRVVVINGKNYGVNGYMWANTDVEMLREFLKRSKAIRGLSTAARKYKFNSHDHDAK